MDCRDCVEKNKSGQSCSSCKNVDKDGLCKDIGYKFCHKAASVEIYGCLKYNKPLWKRS